MLKYLFAFSFWLPIYSISAQNPDLNFKHVTVDDGLSFNLVFEILKDSYGFMWFGTTDGLNKFDGYEMTVYRHIHGDSTSIPDNSVWALYEDSKGNLWVGTDGGGLSLYDRLHDHFINYQNAEDDSASLSHNSVNAILEDAQGKLWIGSYGGGINIMTAPGKFRRIQSNGSESLSNDVIQTMFKDSKGNMRVCTQAGLNLYDNKGQKFRTYLRVEGDPTTISNNNVLAITEDRKGNIWLGTWGGGVNRLDTETQKFESFFFDHNKTRNRIGSIITDSNGQLWVGTLGNGLSKFDERNNSFRHYSHDPLNPGSIINNNIWILYEDEQNFLWMGTESGISKLDLKRNPIQSLGGLNHQLKLSHPVVNDFDTDRDGSLLVATEKSIEKVDYQTIKTSRLSDPGRARLPKGLVIWSICMDRNYDLWVSTYGDGLFRFSKNKKPSGGYNLSDHFQSVEGDPNSLSSNFCSFVYEDNQGTIWAGTYGQGLNRLDRGAKSFKRFLVKDSTQNLFKSISILNLYDDLSGDLWVGTHGDGLIKLDKKTGNLTHFQKDPDNANSLSHNTILATYQTADSILWIGTDGGGLNRLNIHNRTFEILTARDGLPSDVIVGILEDNEGNLWLSTNDGISKFNPNSKKFKNYDQSNGLVSQAFNPDASFRDKSGYFYFGSGNGYNRFHPDNLLTNNHKPPVFITNFRINNQTVPIKNDGILTRHINMTNKITLDYHQKVISFNFATLEFDNPHKNEYTYKLEGFHDNWVHTDASDRLATYTNLNGGEYVFKVKATNSDGIWNDQEASLTINIMPAPWKTWWAYAIYSVLILVLVLVVARAIIVRERLRANLQLERVELEKMQEVNEMKSRFFANVSHEFRTPLTLIAGPVNDILEKEDNPGKRQHLQIVKRNTDRLKRLIDQILDLSQLEAGKLSINEKEINLFEFLRALSSSFSSLAVKKKISYHLEIPKKQVTVMIDDEKLEMILYNLISNALKFTPAGGVVTVSTAVTNDEAGSYLRLAVCDTGPGLDEKEKQEVFERFYRIQDQSYNHEGTGIGLALTKELVELLDGHIAVSGQKGEGAVFQITIPVKIAGVPIQELNSIATPPMDNQNLNEQMKEKSPEGPKILIVEDNEDLRQYIKGILGESYHSMEAADGESGLHMANEEIPDLIISDLMMPKMQGSELCHRIKADEKTSHIPFIMVTAKAAQEDKLAGLEYGADDYLSKPFDRKELRLKVRNILLRRERLQEKIRRELMTYPNPGKVHSQDDRFLLRLKEIVEKQLGEPNLTVSFLSHEMGMSRVQLYRKLLGVTGLSASDFIRNMRIHKAAELLKGDWGSVSDVAYKVGFNNLSYFTKCFKAQYNQTPSEFQQSTS